MTHELLRAEVLGAAHALLAAGLTIGHSGNVSARLGGTGGHVLLAITPHGRYYDELAPHDVIVMNETGAPMEGKGLPPTEWLLHVAVYHARPDVNAVIHAHPPMGSAMAVVGQPIPPILEDQLTFLGGQIKVAPHAATGSEELARCAVETLDGRNACLLANHGVLTVGKDLKAALVACQYLEKLAVAFLYATFAGRVNVLSSSDQDRRGAQG